MKIFGFEIRKQTTQPSLAIPTTNDGAINNETTAGSTGGAYGYYFDINRKLSNEVDQINKYRAMAGTPEIDVAIEDIVNEAIITVDGQQCVEVEINQQENDIPEQIIIAVQEEFKNILQLLDFNNQGYDLFRQWYVDGRLPGQYIVDETNLSMGIQEIRILDPRKIKKVRDITRQKNSGGADVVVDIKEYFVFNDAGINSANSGITLQPDTVMYATSGLTDESGMTVSFLHKCITGDGRIRTPNGWSYMRDINVGDSVYSYDANNKLVKTTVTEKWNNGTKKIVEVKSRHTSFKCTEDHQIMVYDKKTNSIVYVEAKNLITKRHQLILPREDFGVDISYPNTKRKSRIKVVENEFSTTNVGNKRQLIRDIACTTGISENTIRGFLYGTHSILSEKAEKILSLIPVKLDIKERIDGYCVNQVTLDSNFVTKEFAKLFGFLIGDGCVNKNVISFSEQIYPEMNEYYAELIIKYFGKCARVNIGAMGGERKSEYGSYQCPNTLGAELLKDMGFITGATKKRIPEWVFRAKNDIKIAFIEGLMDADGSNCSKIFCVDWAYKTNLANELLIKDIKEIWTSVGLRSGKIGTIKQKPTTICGVQVKKLSGAWQITLTKEQLSLYENVIGVNPVGEDIVYDIEVASDLHNFVVNGTVVHNCIKPQNQLRYMEDAALIYTLSRAPSRRVFYIDIADMPKAKAEQYMQNTMAKYKNKVIYDQSSGEIKDSRNHTSFVEDYWLPRRNGKSTEIQTLPSENITGQIENITYFLNRLYSALNVPASRLRPETGFSLGRSQEITRDEVKFSKFIDRLRKKFNQIFLQSLRVQLVLKGIIAPEDWNFIQSRITFKYLEDNYFAELKESEILENRIGMLNSIQPYVGVYFQPDFIFKRVLKMSDDEIIEEQKKIKESGIVPPQPEM